MKKLLITGGMLLFWAGSLLAQPPDTMWTKTYGGTTFDAGRSVQQTSDGGYIIGGTTTSFGSGQEDLYLIKTDNNGDILWTRTFGGDSADYGHSVTEATDGGYLIVGETYSVQNQTDQFVYIIKTDINGDSLWAKTYGPGAAYSVQRTFDGGYIIGGYDYQSDVWLIKTDAIGDTLWTTIPFSSGICRSVQQTSDSGYILCGFYWPGQNWLLLVKTDSLGDTLWTKQYEDGESCSEVQQTQDKGYVIVGKALVQGSDDVFLMKTDSLGVIEFTKTYDCSTHADVGRSIQVTTDGGYIITGYTGPGHQLNQNLYLVRTNAVGDTIWTSHYGGFGYEMGECVRQTSDGGYIVVGYKSDSLGGNNDVWLLKIEPDIGVEEETSEEIRDSRIPGLVYGNILRISGITNHTEVEIFDILGREVLHQKVTPQKSYISLNNLTSGIYFLSIKEEKPELHKFVLIR